MLWRHMIQSSPVNQVLDLMGYVSLSSSYLPFPSLESMHMTVFRLCTTSDVGIL